MIYLAFLMFMLVVAGILAALVMLVVALVRGARSGTGSADPGTSRPPAP